MNPRLRRVLQAVGVAGLLAGCAGSPALDNVIMMEEPEEKKKAVAPEASAKAPVAPTAPTAPADSADALGQKVLLLPFLDSSDYKGSWDIHNELPRLLADSLARNRFYRIIPVDSSLVYLSPAERRGEIGVSRAAAVGAFLDADWVILGDIEELTMKRFQATVPLGGYRSYEGVVLVDLTLVNAVDGRREAELSSEGLTDSKRTGITNPAAFVPLDRQYFFLDDLPWGSDEFKESLVGKAAAAWAAHAVEGIAEHIKPPAALEVSEPKIVAIDGAAAYINIGLADGIRHGDKFAVWDHGRQLTDPETGTVLGKALPRRVGVIQVEQILNDHLSMARVLEGVDQIRLHDALRAE